MTDRNIHEEFRRAMQEAWEEAVIDTSDLKDEDIPAPDLSFLDHLSKEEPPERGIELPTLAVGKKHRKLGGRFTKVAAAVLAICLISSAMGIFVNSEASYGIRSFVQNIRHLALENEPEITETGAEYLPVTDWGEIKSGKKVVGTLYIPEYIPKGYTFQKAEFADASGGRKEMLNTSYYYRSGDKLIDVTITRVTSGNETSVLGELEQSPISGRDMYVALDEERKEYVITCVEQGMTFFVSAPVSKYEAFKIIEGIKKQDN